MGNRLSFWPSQGFGGGIDPGVLLSGWNGLQRGGLSCSGGRRFVSQYDGDFHFVGSGSNALAYGILRRAVRARRCLGDAEEHFPRCHFAHIHGCDPQSILFQGRQASVRLFTFRVRSLYHSDRGFRNGCQSG